MPPNIDITADHVDLLKQAGSGSLLVWEETTGAVRTADAARPDQLGAHTLVVAGYEQLAFAGADADPQAQDPAALPAARLVPALQELAEEVSEEWPLIRALTPTAQPLRQALAAWGLHLCRTVGAWHLRGHRFPQLEEIYRHPATGGRAHISSPLGYAAPVRVRVTSARGRRRELAVDASALSLSTAATALSAATRSLLLD
ncbi:hypothetical protein FZ103_10555 [Streptomonospora sp. PA3]|uniref:hypothetical protein n=1 Tax=Streptomonospora sp. PA3 TaxID=2607326 RepID=UPI0012DDD558|nr:hypothetical protein [Streptomonospora sp. PA3]MUL41611.1 hypothetical protein [Streptomonospora sp. PA3]